MTDSTIKPPHLVQLQPKAEERITRLRATAAEGMRGLDAYREYMQTVARERRISYDAHIAQGFTPAQALELCKGY